METRVTDIRKGCCYRVRNERARPLGLPLFSAAANNDHVGNRCRITTHTHTHSHSHLQYDSAEWEPAFLRQAREFLFFPLLPMKASKRVPIFDRGTGSKPEGLRSGFLQADLSLIGCARSHALSLSQKKKKAQKFSPPAAGETPDPG